MHNICILSKDETFLQIQQDVVQDVVQGEEEEFQEVEGEDRNEYDDFQRFMFREKVKQDVLRFNNYNYC